MATTPSVVTVDRIEPTKARLTWPTDATSIHTWYAIHIEGSAPALVDQLTNHDPGHHSDTPEWMTSIGYIVGGLTPATTYRMFVRMHDGGTWNAVPDTVPLYVGGTYTDSPVCEFTTAAAVPHCPLNAHLLDKAEGSVTLRCAHSDADNAQGTATKYGLFVRASGETTWPATPTVDNLIPVAATVGSFVTVTYAAPTTGAYDYCFKAYNAHGWSEPSNTIQVVADGGPVDVATFAAFKSALATARPGDIVRCTAAMTMDTANTTVPNGIVMDFGGFTHEYTAMVGSGPNRIFLAPATYLTYGCQWANGTIHIADSVTQAVHGCVVLYGADGYTMRDFQITGGCQSCAKLDAPAGSINHHFAIYGGRSEPQSTTTVVDLGPRPCEDMIIWDYTHYQQTNTGISTSADGIANELGYGFLDLRAVTIDGVNGDGIDLKSVGDYYCENIKATRTVRNSVKIWGVQSSRGQVDDSSIIACGLSAVFGAGEVVINDSLFEAYGYDGTTGHVETAGLIWGNGRMDNGLPGYGGLTCTMNRCNIRRRPYVGTVQSASLLTATDGGDSNPLEPGGASTVQFHDCIWYSAGTHSAIISAKVKAGSIVQYDQQPIVSVIKTQAEANNWPAANHDNSRWLDEDWSETDPDPPVNLPPSVSINGETTGLVDASISGVYTATDPEGDTLTVGFSLGKPVGSSAELTAGSGVWSFIPDVAGAYTVTVTANDGVNATVTTTHSITVEDVPVEPPAVEKRSVAILFGWYKEGTDYTNSDHWFVRDPYTGISVPHTAHHSVYSPVSYLSKDWWKNELRDIKAAGFDIAAIQTYPYTVPTSQGFPVLSQAWQEMKAAGENPVQLGFFFESFWLEGYDLTNPAYREAAWFRMIQCFGMLPEMAWKDAMGTGMPFLGFYSSGGIANWNGEYFTDLKARFQTAYNASPYIAVEQSWDTLSRPVAASVGAVYAWSTHVSGPVDKTNGTGGGCVNIFVGYSRSEFMPYVAYEYKRLREDGVSGPANPTGTWYDWCWQQAIQQRARVVMAQWNELAESITLCHTSEHGRAYIDASAAWNQIWKGEQDPGDPVVLIHPSRVRVTPDFSPLRAWSRVPSVELDAAHASYTWWGVQSGRGLRYLRGIADVRGSWNGTEFVSNSGYSPDFMLFDWTPDAWAFHVPAGRSYTITFVVVDKPASAGARVYLQYDAHGNRYKSAPNCAAVVDGASTVYANGMYDLTGDGKTKTLSWTVDDARFSREENGASQFRFVCYFNRPVYVTRVLVVDNTRGSAPTRRIEPYTGGVVWKIGSKRVRVLENEPDVQTHTEER